MERTAGWISSTERSESAAAPDRVVLGSVVGAHGLQGAVRVRIPDGDATNLLQVPRVTLGFNEEDPEAVDYEVARVAPGSRGEVRVWLEGIDRREQAESLCGALVMARPGDLAPLEDGEFYGYQLVGCRVEDREGRTIGTVRNIWSTGAPDLLVVESPDGTEHLIPAAREIMQEVDVRGRRIVIDAIPGLL